MSITQKTGAVLPQQRAAGTPTAIASAEKGARAAAPRGRDTWIDLLRALALVRVVTFHAFNFAWLPIVFPSMGIMFALGGRLVASSLDRQAPRTFYRKRIRRLLPPVWLLGAILVPFMLFIGWASDESQGSSPFSWGSLWLWVFPLSDPPSSSAGFDWVEPLWYIRTYLWLILLSPALLWLFRRWPVRVVAVPVILMGLLTTGLLNLGEGRTADIVGTLAMYTCCWLAGFAHYDGKLQRLRLGHVLLAGAALMLGGLWYAFANRALTGTYNPDDVPLAGMLFFTGAVLVLLRFYPKLTWLQRFPTAGAILGLINSRAMTIYLWNNVALTLAPLALHFTPLSTYDTTSVTGALLEFAAGWVLIFVAILLFGWVEDVAAARRPRLLPWNRAKRTAPARRDVSFRDNVAARSDAEVGDIPASGAGSVLPAEAPATRGGAPTRTSLDRSPRAGGPTPDVVFFDNAADSSQSVPPRDAILLEVHVRTDLSTGGGS